MTLQVGVKVLLFNPEGKLLLLLRSSKYGKAANKWDIPGGRIEPGSTLMENLAREVMEETGLRMTTQPVLVAAQDILKFTDTHVVRITYRAETEGEPVLDGVEHSEYRWAGPEELSAIPNLDSYVRKLLDEGRIVL